MNDRIISIQNGSVTDVEGRGVPEDLVKDEHGRPYLGTLGQGPGAGHEIVRTLIASTKHIPAAENARMAAGDDLGLIVDNRSFGYLIYCGHPEENWSPQEFWSTGLWAILDRARSLGCGYLILDADGPVVEGLPTYEW